MARHSNGPWKWEEGQPKIFSIWNGKDYCIASVEECRLGWHEDRGCEAREAGANARLIAAAPELLEALKAAKEVVDVAERMTSCRSDDDFVWSAQKMINEAIAKAEGK